MSTKGSKSAFFPVILSIKESKSRFFPRTPNHYFSQGVWPSRTPNHFLPQDFVYQGLQITIFSRDLVLLCRRGARNAPAAMLCKGKKERKREIERERETKTEERDGPDRQTTLDKPDHETPTPTNPLARNAWGFTQKDTRRGPRKTRLWRTNVRMTCPCGTCPTLASVKRNLTWPVAVPACPDELPLAT